MIKYNYGRVAQLAERLVDVEKVTGSNPVPPTFAGWCNGSTAAFGAVSPGSNPGPAALKFQKFPY